MAERKRSSADSPPVKPRWVDRLLFLLLAASVGSLCFTIYWPASSRRDNGNSVSADPTLPLSPKITGPLPPTGQRVGAFTSQSYLGAEVSLEQLADQRVVVLVFLGTECPLATTYASRLGELARAFADRGVTFLGVNSNQQDSLADIAAFVRTHDLPFDIIKDTGNKLADQLEATRTPEVFVLDDRRAVRYHGRIDDQYEVGAVQRPTPIAEFLKVAIEELLEGKPVAIPSTPLVGCLIGRIYKGNESHTVTYSNQVARILQNRCVVCHRPGQNAPFALTSYEQCAGWAPTIAEVVQEGRMPPWHADPRHGTFRNARRLSSQEKADLLNWVIAGAPQGDHHEVPQPVNYPEGWRIEPDLVVPMADKPFRVPARGAVDYQYFTVDPGFATDRWICAADIRPGDPRVVHHILVMAVPPDSSSGSDATALPSEYIVAIAPGSDPMTLPRGMAKRIPAGSKLRFEVHYTPWGVATEDLSRVAFKFVDAEQVDKEVGTLLLQNTSFRIPPDSDNYKIDAREEIREDTLLWSVFPHAHLRAKSFIVEAEYPGGGHEILLSVPKYDFNWQHTYRLLAPKVLPAGSAIHCTAFYDNSAANIANPDPTKAVGWGPQQWDEMMMCYMELSLVGKASSLSRHPRTDAFVNAIPADDSPEVVALHRIASNAASSHQTFADFAFALMDVVPQIDGLSISFIDERYMRIRRAAFRPSLEHVEKRLRGKRFHTIGLTLATYARENRRVVHQSIASVPGIDFTLLRQEFASSMHLPIDVNGKRGVISILSTETGGFPTEAVDLIERTTKLMDLSVVQ